MINRENKAYKKAMLALETLFLALAGIFLIYRISRSTTFHLHWPSHFESFLMWSLTVTALVRLLGMGLRRWETPVAVALVMVYGTVYRVGGFSFLWFLAAFTVGFIGIDYRKIFRMYLLTAGVFYVVTILAGQLGVISNLVFAREGRGVRSAWGMSYYTDFASLGLFIVMWLWVACRRLPGWAMLVFCGIYALLPVLIARSVTSTICAAMLVCGILYLGIERRWIDKRPSLRRIKRIPDLLAMYGFPLLAAVMFAMMLLYARQTGIGLRLNNVLTDRLRHSVDAWRNYGVKPFGTPFKQNGLGFSTFPTSAYNFVDSTYPLVLLRYGWVTFLVLCLSWVMTARRVSRSGDRRLLLVMAIIAVHSFAEHHFIDSHFNILVAMPLASFAPALGEGREATGAEERAQKASMIAWTVTGLMLAIGAIIAGPALLSRLKTVLELLHYGHDSHVLRLILVIVALLFSLDLTAWASNRLVRAALVHKGMRGCIPTVAVLLACAVMGTGAWLFADRRIDKSIEAYSDMIESDRRALEIAVRAGTGRVYSGVLPELYVRAIDGMDRAAFFEDDLSRLRGNTVLLPTDTERDVFIDNGFLYVPVSERHALYTGDPAVAEALTGAGYHCTGYYSSPREIDLEEVAALNGLDYDTATGLRLSGTQDEMNQGPWQDLYTGHYTATWTLALPDGADLPEGKVCTLSITSFKGETIVIEKEIDADAFDAEGRLTYSMPFYITDSRNVAFEARTKAGTAVNIEAISFARTPQYDVHTLYDDQLKKIRTEYYDANGAPVLRKEGWFACEFGYDRNGNNDRVCFYDADGALTLTTDGYAERRYAFNALGQVVREEYYDAQGRPVESAKGYAAVEYDYDTAGQVVNTRCYDRDGAAIGEPNAG